MNFPEDLKYTKEHEWARQKGGRVTVGITDFAQDQLGDVVYVELPAVGDEVKRGESFGVVESTKAVSELFLPVAGEIVETNRMLIDEPGAVNEDPHGEGWLVKLKVASDAEPEGLMTAAAYEKFVAEEAKG